MVLGLEILFEHPSKQRSGLSQLIPLVLHGYPSGVVGVEDVLPGVEQVDDPVLHAAQALIPLSLVGNGLLAHALKEDVEELRFKRCPHIRDVLRALRRGQLRLAVTGEAHQCPSKATIERTR